MLAAEPARSFSNALLRKARGLGGGIRAAIFDVDGVLTDGRLFYNKAGDAIKAFHVHDGFGIKLLKQVGIQCIVISGRNHPSLAQRLDELGVTHRMLGQADKAKAAEDLLTNLQLAWVDTAVIGDDWPDLPLMRRAALAVAPAGAHPEVLKRVDYVCQSRGGEGAAREFCDLLLMAAGHYEALLSGQSTSVFDAR